MELVIATNNLNKLKEIKAIIGDKFDKLYSLKELGIDIEIEETGTTLEENALIKARTILNITKMPTLADDTGLMVDALNGAPGVYSARYAGEDQNDKANRSLLLKNLEGIINRNAHFETAIALCYPDGKEILAKGKVEGYITTEEIGSDGFGYDSIFFSTELGHTFAQANSLKNTVSHRSRALANLLEKL